MKDDSKPTVFITCPECGQETLPFTKPHSTRLNDVTGNLFMVAAIIGIIAFCLK